MTIPRTLIDASSELSLRSGRFLRRIPRLRICGAVSVFSLLVAMPGFTQEVTDRSSSETVDAIARSVPETLVETRQNAAADRQRHVLIVVGLAGDAEHQQRFQSTVGHWRDWLVDQAGVTQDHITILSGRVESGGVRPATAEVIRATVAELANQADAQDAVWVFLLGHGSQDRREGWFHLPGADLSASMWADLFVSLKAEEQVFWLTHSASGSFLKPMSRPGRVVITATDPEGEVNETRFPHALAAVMQRKSAESLEDSTSAPRGATLLGLYREAVRHVRDSFEQEELVPTEHAQLDDNGDGVGTEVDELADTPTVQAAESSPDQDSESAEENIQPVEAMDESGAPVDGRRAGQISIGFTMLFTPRPLPLVSFT